PTSGTSLATPQVAGVAAIILEQAGNIGPAEVRRILVETAVPIPLHASDFCTPLWGASALDASAPGNRPGLADLHACVAEAKATRVGNAKASIVAAMAKAATK